MGIGPNLSESENHLHMISEVRLRPDSELKLTQNTQPAILTISFSIFSVLKKEFGINFEKAGFFAGHSLGEYSALVCAESLLFDDAVHLVFERGRAMQEAVPVGEGSMLAVLNLDIKEVNDNSFLIHLTYSLCLK